MFGYNEVFSKENKEVLFFIKPESLIESSLTNDVRAYPSSVKTNGELIDSWTKFGINDFYDVDDHGPINKIVNFKDNVYFLQDQGTGVYAINREAVTTTDDGVPTELGTSKGWGKHQYYSKENGSIHQWAVAVTDRGIYFLCYSQKNISTKYRTNRNEQCSFIRSKRNAFLFTRVRSCSI